MTLQDTIRIENAKLSLLNINLEIIVNNDGLVCLQRLHEQKYVNLSYYKVPECVEYIKSKTFSDCTSLKLIVFSENLKGIGDDAFKNCTALEEVNFSKCREGVEIGTGAFDFCCELKKVVGNIKHIHNKLVMCCDNLETVNSSQTKQIEVSDIELA